MSDKTRARAYVLRVCYGLCTGGCLNNYPWASRVNHAEERIVSTYLISTDFFTGGSDQTKTVHYLGCYDARAHACGNPFCRAVQV